MIDLEATNEAERLIRSHNTRGDLLAMAYAVRDLHRENKALRSQIDRLTALVPAPVPSFAKHEHDASQVRRDADRGYYCQACGDDLDLESPAVQLAVARAISQKAFNDD